MGRDHRFRRRAPPPIWVIVDDEVQRRWLESKSWSSAAVPVDSRSCLQQALEAAVLGTWTSVETTCEIVGDITSGFLVGIATDIRDAINCFNDGCSGDEMFAVIGVTVTVTAAVVGAIFGGGWGAVGTAYLANKVVGLFRKTATVASSALRGLPANRLNEIAGWLTTEFDDVAKKAMPRNTPNVGVIGQMAKDLDLKRGDVLWEDFSKFLKQTAVFCARGQEGSSKCKGQLGEILYLQYVKRIRENVETFQSTRYKKIGPDGREVPGTIGLRPDGLTISKDRVDIDGDGIERERKIANQTRPADPKQMYSYKTAGDSELGLQLRSAAHARMDCFRLSLYAISRNVDDVAASIDNRVKYAKDFIASDQEIQKINPNFKFEVVNLQTGERVAGGC